MHPGQLCCVSCGLAFALVSQPGLGWSEVGKVSAFIQAGVRWEKRGVMASSSLHLEPFNKVQVGFPRIYLLASKSGWNYICP